MTKGTQEQLKRLLALLPEISLGGEHHLADVAMRINVDPDTILSDLRDLSARANDPPGWVENIQIYFDSAERLSMPMGMHFRRPMRLTRDEWRAVELGLAFLRLERAPDERPSVEALLEKVRELTSQEIEGASTRAATLGAERHTDAVATLRAAMRDHKRVEIVYQKGSGEVPDRRTICPFSFVVEQGVWYLVAHCHSERSEESALRIFRLDRVLELKVLSETFEPAQDVNLDELLSDGRAFVGNPPQRLRVRYSAKVARWISEREQGTSNADGSFEVEYPLGDRGWAIRHVLQYGPEAEVLAPVEVRKEVVKRLRVD